MVVVVVLVCGRMGGVGLVRWGVCGGKRKEEGATRLEHHRRVLEVHVPTRHSILMVLLYVMQFCRPSHPDEDAAN